MTDTLLSNLSFSSVEAVPLSSFYRLPIPVIVVNKDLKIVSWNDGAKAFYYGEIESVSHEEISLADFLDCPKSCSQSHQCRVTVHGQDCEFNDVISETFTSGKISENIALYCESDDKAYTVSRQCAHLGAQIAESQYLTDILQSINLNGTSIVDMSFSNNDSVIQNFKSDSPLFKVSNPFDSLQVLQTVQTALLGKAKAGVHKRRELEADWVN